MGEKMVFKSRDQNPSSIAAVANTRDADFEARTVFVRNLPYTFSDSQLQEVFSEIGPVRRSFTVKETGSKKCRGFGYVQFAVAQDAIRAVELKNGTDLHGRKVMVNIAKRRASFEERRTKKQLDSKIIKEEADSLGAVPERPSISKKSEKKELVDATPNNKEDAMTGQRKHNGRQAIVGIKKAAPQHEQLRGPEQNPDGKELGANAQRREKRQLDAVDAGESKKKGKTTQVDRKGSETQKVARTVILGGIVNPEMHEAVLELAKKVGSVDSVQSSLSPQELKGRGLEKDGCKVGAAAVVFTSVKAAAQAVAKLHQKPIGGGVVWARQLGGEGSKPRKWRVIIRNLPFNVTEEKVRDLFASAGFVWEAKVPRKEDGQARGFAFASFTSNANAEKAIRLMNGKAVQKRPIAVDWAVERSAYEQATDARANLEYHAKALPSDIDDEETASEDDSIKKHDFPVKRLENGHSKEELPTSLDEINLAKKVLNRVVSFSLNNEPEDDVDLEKSNGGPDKSRHHSKSADKEKATQTKSRDLGKTIFIKNLPFDTDANTLKNHFSTFGKVQSTFLVLHPKTKRPAGTAFLEFHNVEGAEAALAAAVGTTENMKFANGITLSGRKLEVLKAVEKESAEAIKKEKLEHAVVDRRNLYLTKEGKLELGMPAANGVSEEDMSKRRQLDHVKAMKLRSPDFHVSRTRLAVYNVPKSMERMELKNIFINAVKSRATKQQPVIKQVKILKDEIKGGKSRGVAFVEFTEHQHALVALRVLNNNPETFGPERRPIVGFAIENLQMLRKRQTRQLQTGRTISIDDQEANGKGEKQSKRKNKKSKTSKDQAMGDGKQGSLDETKDLSAVDAKGRFGPDLNAQSRGRKKLRPGFTSTDHGNLTGKKRKRNEGGKLNGFDGDRDRVSVKLPNTMQKVPKGNANGGKTNPILSKNKGRSRKKADGSKEQRDGHHKVYGVQRKPSKATHKKKGSKLEVEDKLEKLVAVYRDKYFSNASRGAKENKMSTDMRVSNDLKRWFE